MLRVSPSAHAFRHRERPRVTVLSSPAALMRLIPARCRCRTLSTPSAQPRDQPRCQFRRRSPAPGWNRAVAPSIPSNRGSQHSNGQLESLLVRAPRFPRGICATFPGARAHSITRYRASNCRCQRVHSPVDGQCTENFADLCVASQRFPMSVFLGSYQALSSCKK
jgi:hypothetical protein